MVPRNDEPSRQGTQNDVQAPRHSAWHAIVTKPRDCRSQLPLLDRLGHPLSLLLLGIADLGEESRLPATQPAEELSNQRLS
eukprot:1491217-Amphidinium_carterae.1